MDIAGLVVALLVGVGIGVLSGLLGIGGGTVMVPIFKLGFGMSPIGATATSLLAIIPTSISGSITHVRQKTCIPLLGVLAGIGGACFSPVGVQLATMSPGWLIMLVAACVIAYSAYTMLLKALKMSPKKKAKAEVATSDDGSGAASAANASAAETASAIATDGVAADGAVAATTASTPAAPDNSDAEAPFGFKRLWKGLVIGAFAGLIAGYVGVGGGFLMVPLFISILHIDMRRASGSSLVAIGILSIPGALMQIMLGNANILIALAVVIGSVPGAILGARLVTRVPERSLRFFFAGVLFIGAILLVVQELGIF